MKELYTTEIKPKRAFLVGIRDNAVPRNEADSLTRELAGLAETLGLDIAGQETVHIRENHSQYAMGAGKAQELADKAAELGADCLVFDRDISPSQQRNWEKLSGISAVDRQELIIQIFAGRAKTREAELQVALAELLYSLPRLSHKYIDLSRQRGGRYGTKGSGETRLETDRRLVQQRIFKLKQELIGVRKHRAVQRKKREKTAIPSCALVGYTNAGKSSLFKALTAADVLVEDKLFATLDPAVRLLPGKSLTLIDTVGFIRRLPHNLVDAFRSTLEEVSRADALIHVLDASDPDADHYTRAVLSVLRDLGADTIPLITVLNKTDLLDHSAGPSTNTLGELQKRYPGSIALSAKNRTGLDELVRAMEELLSAPLTRFRFPPDRHDLAALVHRSGTVVSEQYEDSGIEMEARVEKGAAERLSAFAVLDEK
ncbi:GTPase HflX [Spirochaetia bacterium]|nr:GTPase HflX [Spirochaetia bacterium]